MDTPTIAAYYRESDPMKRKALLEQSIADNEDPEGNEIRKRIWEKRYAGKSSSDRNSRPDGYMALWMTLEYNKNASGGLFGKGRSRKEILKALSKTGIPDFQNGTELERELIYREVLHMVATYAALCEMDKTYGSLAFGLMNMKEKDVTAKLKNDLYETGIRLAHDSGLSNELSIIAKATKEFYERKYPEDGSLDSKE